MAVKYLNGIAYDIIEGVRCDENGNVYKIISGMYDNKFCYSTVELHPEHDPIQRAFLTSVLVTEEGGSVGTITNAENMLGNTPDTYGTIAAGAWMGALSLPLYTMPQYGTNGTFKIKMKVANNTTENIKMYITPHHTSSQAGSDMLGGQRTHYLVPGISEIEVNITQSVYDMADQKSISTLDVLSDVWFDFNSSATYDVYQIWLECAWEINKNVQTAQCWAQNAYGSWGGTHTLAIDQDLTTYGIPATAGRCGHSFDFSAIPAGATITAIEPYIKIEVVHSNGTPTWNGDLVFQSATTGGSKYAYLAKSGENMVLGEKTYTLSVDWSNYRTQADGALDDTIRLYYYGQTQVDEFRVYGAYLLVHYTI